MITSSQNPHLFAYHKIMGKLLLLLLWITILPFQSIACSLVPPNLLTPTYGATNVVSTNGSSIFFDWDASSGATDYRICVATSNLGFDPTASIMLPNGTIINEWLSSNTSYQSLIGTLQPNTTYYWVVRSYSSSLGCSVVSSIYSFTTGCLQKPNLSSPSNFATSVSVTNSVSFNWSASPGATNYRICIATSQSGFDPSVSNPNPMLPNGTVVNEGLNNSTSYQCPIGTLQPNTTYYWVIRSHKSGFPCSTVSSIFRFTTGSFPSCTTPTGFSSNPSSTTGYINWNTVSSAQHYEIQYRPLGGSFNSSNSSSSQYTLSSLSPGTCYEWQVRAKCYGTNNYSNWGNLQQFCTTCSTPTGLNDYAVATTASTNWSNVSGAQSYQIQYRVQGGNYMSPITVSNRNYTITGLSPGTCYEWRVLTDCGNGNTSNWSSPKSFCTTCNVPTGFNSTPTTNTANLDWVGTTPTYELRYRKQGTINYNPLISINSSSFNLTGLSPNSCYEWQIRANCSVNSNWSATQTFCTLSSPCNIPTSLHLNSPPTTTSVFMDWDSISGVQNYQMQYWIQGNNTNPSSIIVSGSNYRLTSLSSGTCYEWRVLTDCGNGNTSNWSSTDSFCTEFPLPDITITNQSANITNIIAGNSINLIADHNYIGTAPNNNNTELGFYLSTDCNLDSTDILLGQASSMINPTTPTESENATITIPTTTNAGNYYILFVADHTHQITEIDENNNLVCEAVSISPALPLFTFFTNKDTVQTGDTINVAIRVDNIPNVGIFSFEQTIQFDTAQLSYIDYTNQTNMSFIGAISDPTQIPLSYFLLSNPLSDSTTIGFLRFVVKMGHGEHTTFSLTSSPLNNVYDPMYNPVPYTSNFDTIFTINPAIISGNISTEIGLPMPYVAVVPSINNTLVDTTDMMGNYSITTVMDATLSIHPQRNGDAVFSNGIDVRDIMTIIGHLRGFAPLTSPYKKIAANVSANLPQFQDTTINTLDLGLIQQVILGNKTNFGGEQYRFVPSSHNFPNGWYEFPDSITYPLARNLSNQDFVGIKLGDVTNDWNNNLRSATSGPTISLGIDSTVVPEHASSMLHLTACGMQGISAYQMTITWDSTVARLDNIIANNSWQIQYNPYNAGTATIIFFEGSGLAINIPDGTRLFSLPFRAVGNAGTSTTIEINSTITPLLVLDGTYNPLTVQTNTGLFEITSLNNLPIKLSTFNVKKGIKPLTVDIDWTTTEEINTKSFNIEWSQDGGLNFESIATISAQGNSNTLSKYRYIHPQARVGDNYYRLKSIDKDGSFDYSNVKVVTFDATSSNNVYPNPFNDQLYIQYHLNKTQDISLKLVNSLGQVIIQEKIAGLDGENVFIWDLKNKTIPSGNYVIVLAIDDQIQTQKLIKF